MNILPDIDIQLIKNVNKFDHEIKKSRILSEFVTSTASSFFETMKSFSTFRKSSTAFQMIIQMIIQIEDDDETTDEVENEIEKENDDDEDENDVEKIKNEILTQTQS